MRRIIIKEFDKLAEDLSNFVAMFNFRMKDYCVKAEEVALLSVKMEVEGEMQNLDKCTTIGKKDDFNFMIFPNYDEDMPALQIGLMRAHPEWKQKIETMTIDIEGKGGKSMEKDVRYVLVTMPDVDDERYELLKNVVKAMYEECKVQMEMANKRADVKLAELTAGEEKADIDLVKSKRDELNEQWNGKRDELYDEKLKEIEDAHNKWLAEKNERDKKREEQEAARGEKVTRSMRMGHHDEEVN